MTEIAPAPSTSKAARWTGLVISTLIVLLMGVMPVVMLITSPKMMLDGMARYGYPLYAARPIAFAQIACALLYAIPRTSVLGAVLLTGYLGGAVATHVHAAEPFWMALIAGVLVWLGLVLRDARVRAVLPLRR